MLSLINDILDMSKVLGTLGDMKSKLTMIDLLPSPTV